MTTMGLSTRVGGVDQARDPPHDRFVVAHLDDLVGGAVLFDVQLEDRIEYLVSR